MCINSAKVKTHSRKETAIEQPIGERYSYLVDMAHGGVALGSIYIHDHTWKRGVNGPSVRARSHYKRRKWPQIGEWVPAGTPALPSQGTDMGFHCYKKDMQIRPEPRKVVTEVRLTGQVVEHDTGYRAEYAEIIKIRLHMQDAAYKATLERAYGVPVWIG
jgi:hypothetical protein